MRAGTADACRAEAAAAADDAPELPRDRREPGCLAKHGEDPGDLRLPQARRLVAERGDRPGERARAGGAAGRARALEGNRRARLVPIGRAPCRRRAGSQVRGPREHSDPHRRRRGRLSGPGRACTCDRSGCGPRGGLDLLEHRALREAVEAEQPDVVVTALHASRRATGGQRDRRHRRPPGRQPALGILVLGDPASDGGTVALRSRSPRCGFMLRTRISNSAELTRAIREIAAGTRWSIRPPSERS